MVDTSDPPSDERKRSLISGDEQGISRNLVNRQTFILATRIIMVMRLAELVKQAAQRPLS